MDKKCIDVRCLVFTGASGVRKNSVIVGFVGLEKLGHGIIHGATTYMIVLERDGYINGSSCMFLKKMLKQENYHTFDYGNF
jgi:hypothetical protein